MLGYWHVPRLERNFLMMYKCNRKRNAVKTSSGLVSLKFNSGRNYASYKSKHTSLIAAPAHQWNTILTIVMQAQAINVKVVGQQRKTVISLDMDLYMPAKKLQMARHDLNNKILRPEELHILMA